MQFVFQFAAERPANRHLNNPQVLFPYTQGIGISTPPQCRRLHRYPEGYPASGVTIGHGCLGFQITLVMQGTIKFIFHDNRRFIKALLYVAAGKIDFIRDIGILIFMNKRRRLLHRFPGVEEGR